VIEGEYFDGIFCDLFHDRFLPVKVNGLSVSGLLLVKQIETILGINLDAIVFYVLHRVVFPEIYGMKIIGYEKHGFVIATIPCPEPVLVRYIYRKMMRPGTRVIR